MPENPHPMAWVFTIDPGSEKLVETEWQERCLSAGLTAPQVERWSHPMRGVVKASVSGNPRQAEAVVFRMRTVHHASRLLRRFALADKDDLARVGQEVQALPLPELAQAQSFRVSCNRVGQHGFDSYAVMKEVGQLIRDRFGTPVDLEQYEVDLRADVYELDAWIGLQLTRRALSHRFEGRSYLRRASLKATVAYALLRLAEIDPQQPARLLDPFCGAGTILLEAGHVYPQLELYGSDLHTEPVEGTRANLTTYGLEHRAQLLQADARHLDQSFPPEHFDYLVTNPPYGLRMGQKIDLVALYRRFLQGASPLLKPKGSLVILVLKSVLLRQALKAAGGWYVYTHRRVEVGGKFLTAFHLKRNG